MEAIISGANIRIADGITPELRRIAGEMQRPRQLMAACGQQMAVEFRRHFTERDAQPNKMGWPSRHFWAMVRRNTQLSEVTESKAVVTVASIEYLRKVYSGGPITPKRAKRLSIPLTAQAYAAGSASLFPGKLKLNKGRLEDESGQAQYLLARSVNPPADPDALPDQGHMESAILSRARAVLARALRT